MNQPGVLEGALRIARVEYPDLDAPAYLERVEAFARGALKTVRGRSRRTVVQLNDYFFDRLGFHGNRDDYYDPRNSYLNDVIDRRTGIPITLSALYGEIGRRLGLPVRGVGFPGHFLAKVALPAGDVIVDCFNAKVLSRRDCGALLRTVVAGNPKLHASMLEAAAPRDILSRMLQNLRQIYAARKDYARAARWIDLDLELRPDATHNYRERGMLYVQMEHFGKAIADFETYLRRNRAAKDRPQIEEQIRLIRKLLSHLN